MKWSRVILLVLVSVLSMAAPAAGAAAIPKHFGNAMRDALKRHAWVAAALPIAAETFPAACSPITVAWTRGIGDDRTGVALVSNCTIVLNPWLIPSFIGWRLTCATIVHEVGHLSGLGHSTDPMSPMFPLVHPIGQCPKAPPLGLRLGNG